MIFLLALIPATMLTIAGYVALFLAQRSEGSLRSFGRYLGIWAFTLAVLVVLGGMFAAGHLHRMHGGMWGPHAGRAYHPWAEGGDSGRLFERRERPEPGAPPGPAAPPPEMPNPPAPPPASH